MTRTYRRSPAAAIIAVAGGTLTSIGDACGVSASTVSRWLAGKQVPRSDFRDALVAEVGSHAADAAMRLLTEGLKDEDHD